ncbi:MAG: enoyl-CoA hydratase, partial [Dehalococcoidales bacterium]|nr:enoyl-CoA hydratase [Dehalococcoidales bacterium]
VGYVRRGMVPAAGSAWYLPRLLGLDKALKIILTSEMMNAQEMEKLGLVTMVVPDGELMDTAIDLAEQIVKAPMLAVQAAKQAVYESMNLDLAESLDLTMGIRQKLLTTNDYHESATAFVEKREPTFKGE